MLIWVYVGQREREQSTWFEAQNYVCRYGRPGCSDEEVEGAAEASAIHESIANRFPQGYNTLVGMSPLMSRRSTLLQSIQQSNCLLAKYSQKSIATIKWGDFLDSPVGQDCDMEEADGTARVASL